MSQVINGAQEELEKKAAEIIAKKVPEIMETMEKTNINLGVVGGRSVFGVLSKLSEMQVPWSCIHLFMIDERFSEINDPQSNYSVLKEALLDKLVPTGMIPKENIHPFLYKPEKHDFGIGDYSKLFQELGTVYDIALLSSGEDGHVGSLFPYHESIEDQSPFFIHVRGSPKPPANRMSASKNLLSQSTVGVLLFFGPAKKDAFLNYLNDDLTLEACPAKIIDLMQEGYVLSTTKK